MMLVVVVFVVVAAVCMVSANVFVALSTAWPANELRVVPPISEAATLASPLRNETCLARHYVALK